MESRATGIWPETRVGDPTAFSTQQGPGFRDLGKAEFIVVPGHACLCLFQNWGVFLGLEGCVGTD